jgi:phosphoenolpyruvate carboxykinase (ATP)
MQTQTQQHIPTQALNTLGLSNNLQVHYQLHPEVLAEQTIHRGLGVLNDTGALCINTGEFTGRSPQDKFIVKDDITKDTVHWNNFNIPIDEKYFFQLKEKVLAYLNTKSEIWVRDAYACADNDYKLNIRVVNEQPSSNLFAYNMFLRPTENALDNFKVDWHIIQAPGFKANPAVDGTRQHNFAIVSFTHKTILIGGTGYTGEMKKGIFTILNYILPHNKNVLSMHCSANMGNEGDVAIFFWLKWHRKNYFKCRP